MKRTSIQQLIWSTFSCFLVDILVYYSMTTFQLPYEPKTSHIYINKPVFLWIYMHCNWRFYFIIVSNLVFILELYQIDIYF